MEKEKILILQVNSFTSSDPDWESRGSIWEEEDYGVVLDWSCVISS